MDGREDNGVVPLERAAADDVAALARRMRRANGPVMRVLARFGNQVEDKMELLPPQLRGGLEAVIAQMLHQVYAAAALTRSIPIMPRTSDRFHSLAASLSGAAGGSAGLASALVELPATIGLIFGAMQKVAAEEGFDPASEEVRLLCLDILGSGGPGRADDGLNTSFVGARLGLNGATLHAIIARVAPGLATAMGQKLASQAVPILGAAAGAGINYMFLDHFREMARVRFGLRRLAGEHGEDAVLAAFRFELARVIGPRSAA